MSTTSVISCRVEQRIKHPDPNLTLKLHVPWPLSPPKRSEFSSIQSSSRGRFVKTCGIHRHEDDIRRIRAATTATSWTSPGAYLECVEEGSVVGWAR